jgi:phosphatidylserine decarboxylase
MNPAKIIDQANKLFLYNLQTGQKKLMPVGLGIGFLENKIFREILMNRYVSKFVGFLADTSWISEIALQSDKIPRNLRENFKSSNLKTLNEAFTHRNPRQIFPLETDEIMSKFRGKIMISPADAYLNIREIKNGKIELYPELALDLAKMIGAKNSAKFSTGGKFFLFTLKPHHDHTVDYPFNSKVLSAPQEFSRKKWKIFSTDLNFAKKLATEGSTIFDENHRVVTELLATDYNEPYFLLEIGATNVNSIEQDNCSISKTYTKGSQKSHFNFGSTVIVLLPKNFVKKIKVLDVFLRDFNTSVEVKRRNVIARPNSFVEDMSFHIANEIKFSLGNSQETIIR